IFKTTVSECIYLLPAEAVDKDGWPHLQDIRTPRASLSTKMKVSNVKTSQESSPGLTFSRKRARRSSDDGEEITSPAQSQDPGEGARRVPRWGGEDRRGAGAPRHDELKVDSTTFALTGDSSHNQAMVHWSGQNSSSMCAYVCPSGGHEPPQERCEQLNRCQAEAVHVDHGASLTRGQDSQVAAGYGRG
ncbi:hypothetical protein F7725_005295, partial [Dissostichus mawsoni]